MIAYLVVSSALSLGFDFVKQGTELTQKDLEDYDVDRLLELGAVKIVEKKLTEREKLELMKKVDLKKQAIEMGIPSDDLKEISKKDLINLVLKRRE